MARAKSDHADAATLANILRVDAHLHRRLPADSERAQAISVLARAEQDAVWRRTNAGNELRSLLREYFPAFLAVFAGKSATNLAKPEARAVLAIVPTPAYLAKPLRPASSPRCAALTASAASTPWPRRSSPDFGTCNCVSPSWWRRRSAARPWRCWRPWTSPGPVVMTWKRPRPRNSASTPTTPSSPAFPAWPTSPAPGCWPRWARTEPNSPPTGHSRLTRIRTGHPCLGQVDFHHLSPHQERPPRGSWLDLGVRCRIPLRPRARALPTPSSARSPAPGGTATSVQQNARPAPSLPPIPRAVRSDQSLQPPSRRTIRRSRRLTFKDNRRSAELQVQPV
ncbi:IS110 family transposase [Nocardia sp. GAS34]|uniref:IS110 family transposase n=1 Tax=unclassified Nocardia TaxID=2637762 RepID=UPI003D25C11B